MREKILVSACLTGENCRYDGKNNRNDSVMKLAKYYDLIPICPEVNGGMKTPRAPSEIKGDKVVSITGKDVTQFYNDGAYWACSIARIYHIKLAVLKEKSPSCGCKLIHNGLFDGKVIPGKGITVRKLEQMGVKVIDEDDVIDLLKQLEQKKHD